MPVVESLRRRPPGRVRAWAADTLDRVGLLKPLYLARRRWNVWRLRHVDESAAIDGVPVPPARLRFLTGNHPDLNAFVNGGRRTADSISRQLDEVERPISGLGSMLDFGCGCGRVARNWSELEGVEVHGCDYNPDLVEWCRRSLVFMETRRNELEPPLPYESGKFDFAYAVSIFTHLPLDLQQAWIDELGRVLRPGGLVLVTLAGEPYADRYLRDDRRADFDAGQPAVLREGLAGTNGCFSLHPYAWAEKTLLANFEVASFWPHDDALGLDMYLAVKR